MSDGESYESQKAVIEGLAEDRSELVDLLLEMKDQRDSAREANGEYADRAMTLQKSLDDARENARQWREIYCNCLLDSHDLENMIVAHLKANHRPSALRTAYQQYLKEREDEAILGEGAGGST